MIIKNHVKTYSISWISSSYDKDTALGIINTYYIPETIDELQELCISLFTSGEELRVVGHTSNIYFLPNTNISNLISVRKLNRWQIEGNLLTCQCGVNVKALSKAMIDEGFEGFAGLIDLPGTIGGAIYGNASVGKYSITNMLESVKLLNENGQIEVYSKEDMNFQYRSSALKRQEMKGIILSCSLKLTMGDSGKEKRTAEGIHVWRVKNQPGPLNNLGTTALLNNHSKYGFLAFSIAKLVAFGRSPIIKKNLVLKMLGASHLSPYLFGYNRFIWKDPKAHEFFYDYIRFINKAYKYPKLEIEVI